MGVRRWFEKRRRIRRGVPSEPALGPPKEAALSLPKGYAVATPFFLPGWASARGTRLRLHGHIKRLIRLAAFDFIVGGHLEKRGSGSVRKCWSGLWSPPPS